MTIRLVAAAGPRWEKIVGEPKVHPSADGEIRQGRNLLAGLSASASRSQYITNSSIIPDWTYFMSD